MRLPLACVLAYVLIAAVYVSAQSGDTSEFSTHGTCSPIVERVEGDVSITLECDAELTEHQIEQIIEAIQSALGAMGQPSPADPFHICVVKSSASGESTVNAYTFPFSDIPQDGGEFLMLLKELPGVSSDDIDASLVFRYADEVTVGPNDGSPVSGTNSGVISIPISVIEGPFNNDAHFAFTYLRSQSKSLCDS